MTSKSAIINSAKVHGNVATIKFDLMKVSEEFDPYFSTADTETLSNVNLFVPNNYVHTGRHAIISRLHSSCAAVAVFTMRPHDAN